MTVTKKMKLKNKLLRSRIMRRIQMKSIQTRNKHMKKRNIKITNKNMKSIRGGKTKKRGIKSRRRRVLSGGNEPVSLLPTPYKVQALESGASTQQQSAMIAQRNADLEQNMKNNMIGGDGDNSLPVVQFSGKNSATTNQQSVELTNILAQNRAAGVGDADVVVRE